MIARSTLKRAALTSGLIVGLVGVPALCTWWGALPAPSLSSDEKAAATSLAPAVPSPEGQPSIQSAPPVPRAAQIGVQKVEPARARIDLVTTKSAIGKPDYRRFVVRLPHVEPEQPEAP